jgi:hypothetical protein
MAVELNIPIDEFRELWVNQLLDAKTVGEQLALGSPSQVYFFSRLTGLNVERERAKREAYRQREKAKQANDRQGQDNGEYIPPQGGCVYCPLERACRTYRTFEMDAGPPCEALLPDEAQAIRTGGYVRSGLPGRSPLGAKIRVREIDFMAEQW